MGVVLRWRFRAGYEDRMLVPGRRFPRTHPGRSGRRLGARYVVLYGEGSVMISGLDR
jgi:hypothetical protein